MPKPLRDATAAPAVAGDRMPALDEVDRLLIEALRAHARTTYAELARVVSLSAPSVHDRVHKLEDAGVITGYHAAVAPAALGLGVTALVGVLQSDGYEQDDVAENLRSVAAIEDCWLVAGDETFLVKLRLPDVDALERTLGTLRRVPGVARTRTTVVLSTRWEGRVQAREIPPGPDGDEPATV